MVEAQHDWITLHRVRHTTALGPASHDYVPVPTASCIRLGYDGIIGEHPMTHIWVGWCIHPSLADAEVAMAAPEAIFPFVAKAAESWHVLLLPYTHRGAVNWRGKVEVGSAIRTGPDPGGPLVVITTAGYDAMGPEDMPRMTAFLRRVPLTKDFIEKAEGNVRTAIYASCDDRDGITFTLWASDAAMVAAAYGAGAHHTQLLHHRVEPLFDRSSFTRARVIRSCGNWDGSDPVRQIPAGRALETSSEKPITRTSI